MARQSLHLAMAALFAVTCCADNAAAPRVLQQTAQAQSGGNGNRFLNQNENTMANTSRYSRTRRMENGIGGVYKAGRDNLKKFHGYKPYQACRKSNKAWGKLPSLILLGVHKGGTTDLFHMLTSHDQIRPGWCKEPHFFDSPIRSSMTRFRAINKGETARESTATLKKGDINSLRRDYRKYFRTAASSESDFISVEATPGYFAMPDSVGLRIHAVLQDEVTLAVLLRNPVARTISAWAGQVLRNQVQTHKSTSAVLGTGNCQQWFQRTSKVFDACSELRLPRVVVGLDVADAVRRKPLLTETWKNRWEEYARYGACLLEKIRVDNEENQVGRSIYAPQLFRWLQQYVQWNRRPDNFIVVQSEYYFANQEAVVNTITDHLNLRRHSSKELADTAGAVYGTSHAADYAKVAENLNNTKFKSERVCNETKMEAFFGPFREDLLEVMRHFRPTLVPTGWNETALWL